jgi:cob(I)alamin adenosyltransferase
MIYTKSGDKGKTSLFDGSRVEKFDERINLLGELDELNARIGLLIGSIGTDLYEMSSTSVSEIQYKLLLKTQNLIFDLSGEIANPKLSESSQINFSKFTQNLEDEIDKLDKILPELKNFILPGGSIQSSQTHLCRTQTRKCERILSKISSEINYSNQSAKAFLNRLSDYFFQLARFLNQESGSGEVVWRKSE